MVGFMIAAVVMTAVAMIFVFYPFSKKSEQTASPAYLDQERSNLEIMRGQLEELENDYETGVIGKNEYDEAHAELERRTLEETEDIARRKQETKKTDRPKAVWVAVFFLGLLSAGSILYWVVGTPDTFFPNAQMLASETQNSGDPHDFSQEQFEAMLEDFAARVEKEPNNFEGWLMLARSYAQVGKHEQAIAAYEHVIDRVPDDAGVLADYADLLAYRQNGQLGGKPMALIERALKVDPTHWKALGLAGTYAFDNGDYRAAEQYWIKMKSALPTSTEMARMVDASIEEARRRQQESVSAPKSPVTQNDDDGRIEGMISLAAELQGKVSPDDRLLVYARKANGPKTPIAFISKRVSDLPLSFTLDGSTLAIKSETLTSAGELVVVARVSKSGSANAQTGDLEGVSIPVTVSAKNIQIVIDREIE
ncbi:MAG: c-type cytochrome biogenesis protein CcmI [Burkholderiales bacterium]|jgi:cytochrome c-type biogenesis protein CcmH|nr:c-type cytochrome biogenesis protein CcmI [Burkholderiales bacterium]